MNVIVLGGAGDMGSRAVEDLARAPGIERVTIADRNVPAAQALAGRLAGQGAVVDVRRVDAGSHEDLLEAMRGYDVAASALGPFYLFEVNLVRAAIDAGVDYASICDEWEAASAVMKHFGDSARRSGVTVLIGLGTSPGYSNAGIRYYADRLDRVRRADVYVYQPLDAGGGEAVVRHMLHIICGDVVVWRGGKRVMIPACSEERVVEFPRFGPVTVWNMGHSEPETVPRFLPGIEEVSFFMGFGRGSGLFIGPARRGWLRSERWRTTVARLVARLERFSGGGAPAEGAVRIDVWGEAGGEEVHHVACGTGQMREVTGLSLSIGAQMLAHRELRVGEGGIYAPEGCLDPEQFIRRMDERGVRAYSDLAMTRPVLRYS